jgi:NADH-quinone oxidoreductase subunit L
MVTPVSLLPWIVLFSPLAAALAISFLFLKSPKSASTAAVGGILVSFFGSVWLYAHSLGTGNPLPMELGAVWFQTAGFSIDFGFLIDRLSVLMLLVVTGVGSCIFFYSVGYMRGDSSFPRYFASLSFFAFSMIGIVLSNNFFMMFIFWELVAVSSYLLIGFWFEKPAAADAGNKAFIVNRVADFGLVIGILYLWMLSGAGGETRTLSFTRLSVFLPEAVVSGLLGPENLLLASLLVFCGVVGKSAQFPLYIWLPDAMEGPTPVSALIHAATMVAAGVYLLARSFFLVSGSPAALAAIAWIGTVTALLAAVLAVAQNDIKKILAYSTISQLGYMVTAVGLGSSTAAMFHLTTHAFFKALLFLGAGAMIHSLHTQDIWEMGGLRKTMPVTAYTFLIGTLALCGIPPLSGFFSKDEILALAYEHERVIFFMAVFTAAITAFYMTRCVWVAILGLPRVSKHAHAHEHAAEAPPVMTVPLVVLSILALTGGFIGIPRFIMGAHAHPFSLEPAVAASSVAAALLGITLGTVMYFNTKTNEDPLVKTFGGFYRLLVNKYYLDDFFLKLAGFFQNTTAKLLFWFDGNIVIQKGVNGVAALTQRTASVIRKTQTGRIQTYAMVFGFGVVMIVFFMML